MNIIGGEFAISLDDIFNYTEYVDEKDDIFYYSSGRCAFYQIIKYIKEKKGIKNIIIPNYLCESIVLPIKRLDLNILVCPLTDKLEYNTLELNNIYCKSTAIVIINYFGLQDLSNQIKYIRQLDSNALIIEDDVQAYFEFEKPLGNVDFKFTSLRKTFPVPDGGLVKSHVFLPYESNTSNFSKIKLIASLLKSMRGNTFEDSIYLDLFQRGESMIEEDFNTGMSLYSKILISRVDKAKVKKQRIENSKYLLKGLKKLNLNSYLPLSKDKVPLFIPIYIKNKEFVRKLLFENYIFCPTHWPSFRLNGVLFNEFSENELSLVIDQRYNNNDLDTVLSVLKECEM